MLIIIKFIYFITLANLFSISRAALCDFNGWSINSGCARCEEQCADGSVIPYCVPSKCPQVPETTDCTVTFYSATTYGSGTKYGPYNTGDLGAGTEAGYGTLGGDAVHSMRIDVSNGATCALVLCQDHLIGYLNSGQCPRYETDTTETYNDVGSFGVSSFSLRDITGYTFNQDRACAGANEIGQIDFSNVAKNDMFETCKSECDNNNECLSFEWYTLTTQDGWGAWVANSWTGTYRCVLSTSCTAGTCTPGELCNQATNVAGIASWKLDLYEKTNTVVHVTCPRNAHSFDWDTLTSNAFGKPEITYTINVDESANTDLALNIEVRVPYIVRTKADDQNTANFGTTYVLDFEDFNAHKSLITEPNSCSNRLSSSYTGLLNNEYFQILSDNFDSIGTDENMCYPTPGGESITGWDIDYDASDCNTIVYKGRWEWGNLRQCKNNGNALINPNGEQTFVDENEEYLTLSGTFYVNIVSPFWDHDNDLYGDFYRVYQLLSQPFMIQISKSVYVIGKTGINVMTLSIIAVYKEDQDTDYTLILLTEAAEYMQLTNGQIIEVPLSTQYVLEMQSTAESNGCLNNKAYLCSQLWKITASETTCTVDRDENGNGGIDFSGDYRLRFTPQCRPDIGGYDSETHCNDWLDTHPIYKNDGDDNNNVENGVVLSSHLVFVDGICKPEIFTVQLEAIMAFYEDPNYTQYIDPKTSSHLYQVGEDTVYGEIKLEFPTDTELIFDSKLVNVWLCTFPPDTIVPNPNQNGPDIDPAHKATNGGCFSNLRDGFKIGEGDEFFFHVYGENIAEDDFIVNQDGNQGNDVIHFEFTVPHEIQRDTLYVHAQVEVLLEELELRRRILLDIKTKSKGATTNKISHFGKNIGITNKKGNKPKQPEIPPQEPILPIQQPPLSEPFSISLNSTWIIIIGGLLSIILLVNIIFMCYMNCCKSINGRPRILFNKNRRGGYDSVKHVDSEDFDDSEANLINVN